jgi:hypothetical protein
MKHSYYIKLRLSDTTQYSYYFPRERLFNDADEAIQAFRELMLYSEIQIDGWVILPKHIVRFAPIRRF